MNTTWNNLPPKRAIGAPGWFRLDMSQVVTPQGCAEAWRNLDLGLQVITSVELVERNPPGSGIVAPHFHVSAIHRSGMGGQRACTDQELELVRAAFGMGAAEEDNHGPGIARHLWILVGADREPACPCKAAEVRTVEGPRVRHDAHEEAP